MEGAKLRRRPRMLVIRQPLQFTNNNLLMVTTSFLSSLARSCARFQTLRSCRRMFTQDGDAPGKPNPARVEHLKLTESQSRNDQLLDAEIIRVCQLSPTIKGLTLKLVSGMDVHSRFKAGQWLDFHIPNLDKVGGYSMCSAPSQLEQQGTLILAVKESPWPPAEWVHQKAAAGCRVQIRFGGDFHYPNPAIPTDRRHDLLLVAGGVGINPLASIAFHIRHLADSGQLPEGTRTTLLYSAQKKEELIFRHELDDMNQKMQEAFCRKYFITKESSSSDPDATGDVYHRRLNKQDLEQALSRLSAPVFCYLCGPSPMIQAVNSDLTSLGVSESHIFYENWWQPETEKPQ